MTMDKTLQAAPWEPEAVADFDEDRDMTDLADGANANDTTDDGTNDTNSADADEVPADKVVLVDEIASEFIGSWNRLVSQTNWQKGQVIYTWRTRLIEAGIPRAVYSDESIAKRIGNVSGQHVGRLRRVYEQFGAAEPYANLYWSHYQAALDWDDADEWLVKASNESLSVAAMRIARWEKYGAPADRKPKESEIVAAEPDEDVNPYNDSDSEVINVGVPTEPGGGSDKDDADKKDKKKDQDKDKSDSETSAEPTEGAVAGSNGDAAGSSPEPNGTFSPAMTTGDVITALAKMPELPVDLMAAFEQLKIAILNHKLSKWTEAPSQDVLEYLNAMRALILARE